MTFSEHPIKWDDTKVSRLWDYYSRTPPYSELYFSKVFGDRILGYSKLPMARQIEVLDFGCGPGFIWDHMLRLGARWFYTGVDFSADSVARLRRKAQGHAQFRSAEHVSRLPTTLPDGRFDAVLMIEVVEHLGDAHLDATLSEAARLLKQGGVIVITTPNEEDLAKSTKFCPECGAVYHEWQHVRSWSAQSLAARLKPYGLDLRFAKTLDFADRGALRRTVRLVRALFSGGFVRPHMISVFQKA
jgi:SAM-dependent methyltransferase